MRAPRDGGDYSEQAAKEAPLAFGYSKDARQSKGFSLSPKTSNPEALNPKPSRSKPQNPEARYRFGSISYMV